VTPEIDGTDHEIIALLQADGRRSLADISSHVTLSSSAVKRRIDHLERIGVIVGYTALIDDAKLGRPLEAFTELRFAGTTKVDDIAGVATDVPEVQAVFTMAGDPDALVWLRVSDGNQNSDGPRRLAPRATPRLSRTPQAGRHRHQGPRCGSLAMVPL
jgi:Lrp/AsnC family leucine-responsive transcriptional regulator